MKIFNIAFLLSLAVLITMVPSCAKDESAGLRWGFTTEPRTLDPLSPRNTADGRSILFNVFEGLVKPNTDGTLAPALAESWTIEQNSLVYNFTLRQGVLFHDGTLVTAEDVKFSLDTAIAAGFNSLDNIEEVKILGENKISVILKSMDPDFLPYLTVGIVKAENIDREAEVIGTGPFFLESYRPQRDLVLIRFDDYWQQGLPHLEKVTIIFYANFDTLMVALRGGSIDGSFITGDMAAQLDLRHFEVVQNRSAAVQLLALNNDFAPLNDIRVRRALNYGIDIQEVIDTAFFGKGEPSRSPIIPGLAAYYENSQVFPYNPDRARELLSQAGFNNANRLSLEITVPSNFTMHVNTAQVIVSQLERIGINASIRLVDWGTWHSDIYFGRQYQATIISLDSRNISPRSFLARYHSNNGENFVNFNNADFDRVFDAAIVETNHVNRIRLYKEAQRILVENAASVFIQDIHYFFTFRANAFGGALDYPLYLIDFANIYRTDIN